MVKQAQCEFHPGYVASVRGDEWIAFACKVFHHVERYTIPQYGDVGQDQVTEWSPQQCIDAIKKYCSRFGSNMRGPEEQRRDLLKIAHYACLAHSQMMIAMEREETEPATMTTDDGLGFWP